MLQTSPAEPTGRYGAVEAVPEAAKGQNSPCHSQVLVSPSTELWEELIVGLGQGWLREKNRWKQGSQICEGCCRKRNIKAEQKPTPSF